MKNIPRIFAAFSLFAFAASAKAEWSTVNFDLTRNDPQAYTSDIPAGAFTSDGLKLPLKAGATYTLTSKQLYSGDFSFDLQRSLLNAKATSGHFTIEMVLLNDPAHRKAVATDTNSGGSSDACQIQYFKDGKAAGYQSGGNWIDASNSRGEGRGTIEWLRVHRASHKLWFMQKFDKDAYRWANVSGDSD
jgi:hypothetical protein